jgi:Ca2+-transporting ATPase
MKHAKVEAHIYSQSCDQALSTLNTSSEGLTATQAKEYLATFGANKLPDKKTVSIVNLFFRQFKEIMTIILLVAVVISGLLSELTDALIILLILLLNASLSTYQEFRAQQALKALKNLTAPQVSVRRDGALSIIPAQDLVPGDLVLLKQGDIVPADIRLLTAHSLQIDESALTGESNAVNKQTQLLSAPNLTIGDRTNLAFKSSVVMLGKATGVVYATGSRTQIGKIARLLAQEKESKTPLQIRLTAFSKYLAVVILCVCVIVMFAGILQGQHIMTMVLTALSLAVAAVPEALPAVITISLALGANQLLKQHALIKNLPAVETLGAVTFICTDKTGTLTKNEMEANLVYDGKICTSKLKGEHNLLGIGMAISNDVKTQQEAVIGEATEKALFNMAVSEGFNKADLLRQYPFVDVLPFDNNRKQMTTIHQYNKKYISYTKGAPELVIANCINSEYASDYKADNLLNMVNELSSKGYRVLAIAMRQSDTLPAQKSLITLESGLTFLGLVAISDPIRDAVPKAVQDCIKAGITPVMITGDHKGTAIAIAKQLEIGVGEPISLNGDELKALSESDFITQVTKTNVYTRVSPEQKLKIVKALQKQGHFVAMTGDGVNDAPALQHANIGIAMGNKGTDVARGAADIILLNDDFSTIVKTVAAGRRIYDNICKFIKYTMSSNSGEIWTLLMAPMLGMPIPLLPIHILWINLVTDGLPGLAFSAEPAEKDIMRKAPRHKNESIFANGMWQHILWVGLLIAGLCLGTLQWAYQQNLVYWQTMVFTVLVFAQLFHSLAVRSNNESIFKQNFFNNPFLILAIAIGIFLHLTLIYTPIFNNLFKTHPLPLYELVLCIAISSLVLFAVELEKVLLRHGLLYSTHKLVRLKNTNKEV